MRRLQYQVLRIGKHRFLHLSRSSPEYKYHRAILPGQNSDCRVGELLPADAPVGIGLVGAHRQHRVEQHHSLLSPFFKISVIRNKTSQIIMQFLINIHE